MENNINYNLKKYGNLSYKDGVIYSDDLNSLVECIKNKWHLKEIKTEYCGYNTYAIGIKGNNGDWWFGGCHPQNYINKNRTGKYKWVVGKYA